MISVLASAQNIRSIFGLWSFTITVCPVSVWITRVFSTVLTVTTVV